LQRDGERDRRDTEGRYTWLSAILLIIASFLDSFHLHS
jgi:hypothetical protein